MRGKTRLEREALLDLVVSWLDSEIGLATIEGERPREVRPSQNAGASKNG